MGLKIFEFLRHAVGGGATREVTVRELCEAGEEIRMREIAFWHCCNLVANTLGRCEFRTYRGGAEIRDREYYMLNIEPNRYQNSTAFLHTLTARLFRDGEALIVPISFRDGAEGLAVADSFAVRDPPQWKNYDTYEGVIVRGTQLNKTFREDEILRITLHDRNMKPVIDGVYQAYNRLLQSAVKNYTWGNGQHWKVHVGQMARGGDNWSKDYQELLVNQIKPFLDSESAILPEFDGYDYQKLDGSGSYGKAGSSDSSGITALVNDIFSMTARAFLIPPALVTGTNQDTADSFSRFLSTCIDPIADQLSEELTRKRYGFDAWKSGARVVCDTSSLRHIDLFDNAPNIEKLIGSGFSMNDVRRAMGQPEIDEEWANQHMITKNFSNLENVMSETEGGETA